MKTILFLTRVDRTFFIKRLLAYMNNTPMKYRLLVVSDDKWNASRALVENYIYMPPNVEQEAFLREVIEKYRVNGLFVASGLDLILLNNMRQWLVKTGVSYYSPDEASLKICLSKYEQFLFLRRIDVLTPLIYDYETVIQNGNKMFPLIIKPNCGQGSENIRLLRNIDELIEQHGYSKDMIIQKQETGIEYTVDCFTNKTGELVICVPRIRFIVSGAHTMVAKIRTNEIEILELASKLNRNLKIWGPWNFQLFKNERRLIVHDINPRIANGIVFSMQAGAKFEELIVEELLGNTTINVTDYQLHVEADKEVYCYNSCICR